MIGQASSAGRTLQVPDEYHVRATPVQHLHPRPLDASATSSRIDFGTRWEYFPVPTRPDRGIERYDVDTGQGAALRGRRHTRRTAASRRARRVFAPARRAWPIAFGDKWVARAGYGLTNDPYYGMELIRANYPILIQVKLESPRWPDARGDAVSRGFRRFRCPPKATASSTSRATTRGQGYPKDLNRGYIQSWNFTVQRELPWNFTGQVGYVATHTTRQLGLLDINAGQVIGAGEDGRPLLQQYGRTASTVFLQPVGNGQVRLDAGAAAAAVRRRPQPQRELHPGAGRMSDNENSSWSRRHGSGAGLPEPQLRAHQHRSHATTSASPTSWQIPVRPRPALAERRRRAVAILGGWQVNNMISIMSGPPFTVFADDTSLNLPGSMPDGGPGEARVKSSAASGSATPYYDPTAFAEVTEARFGNTGYNILRGPGLFNWDFGLTREFAITTRRQAAVPHGGVQLHEHAAPRRSPTTTSATARTS